MGGTIAPFPKHQLFDDDGDPADGFQLFVYEAGTSTKAPTYQDSDLTIANTNPIILDSSGRATIFVEPGRSYKWSLATAVDTDPPADPVWTVDNVSAVPSGGQNVDIAGIAGETLTEGQAVYLEDGTIATVGRWYKTSNLTMAESDGAAKVGFVQSDAAVGEAISVRTEGRVTLSGLTPGSTYYLSDTDGAITATIPSPETNEALPYAIGFADSTTTLVIQVNQHRIWGAPTLKTVAFSVGQGCTSGSVDTDLSSYQVFVPANYLHSAGNAIVCEGVANVLENGNTKVMKIKVGSATAVTVWSSTANVANHVVPFRIIIRRRSSTTGLVTGIVWQGTASAGTPTNYMTSQAAGTVAWTSDQFIKVMASGQAANDILLTDIVWYALRTRNAATV